MALEKGIERLVQGFIAAGRPSSRRQTIEVRRAGYIASTELAGKTETRVQLETLVLEGLTIRVFSPLNAPESTDWRRSIPSPPHMTMLKEVRIWSGSMQTN